MTPSDVPKEQYPMNNNFPEQLRKDILEFLRNSYIRINGEEHYLFENKYGLDAAEKVTNIALQALLSLPELEEEEDPNTKTHWANETEEAAAYGRNHLRLAIKARLRGRK